jgi:membrane protein implicated in regulation of membrane protease activity
MGSSLWLVWFILAAFFIVAEIFTAGFFLFWFGIGAAVGGLLALFGLGLAWQLIGFIAVSLILFLGSRRFADRFSKEQPPGIGADRFVGKECVVLEEIRNRDNTGRVRMGSEEWRAESDSGETIPQGTRVRVTRTSGAHLVVERLGEGD